jgi:transposase
MSGYNKYEPELREKILRLYLEEGRTKKSLTEEYNLGKGTITYWLQKRRKECQTNPKIKEETDAYEENKRLRKELAEAQKEIAFLKKAAAFFAKEID